jgi:hypothetical protein
MSRFRRCARLRSCWSAATDRRKLSCRRTFEIRHVIQREGPQPLSGMSTVPSVYGRSRPLTAWPAVIRGDPLHAGFLRRTLAYPRRPCPTALPSCGSLGECRKGRFGRWIHRRVRAFWPAFGRRRLPRQSHPNLVALTVFSGLTCRGLVSHHQDVPNPRLEITSSAAGVVRGRSDAVPNQWHISE